MFGLDAGFTQPAQTGALAQWMVKEHPPPVIKAKKSLPPVTKAKKSQPPVLKAEEPESDDERPAMSQSHNLPEWLLPEPAQAKRAPQAKARQVLPQADAKLSSKPIKSAWYSVIAERALVRSEPKIKSYIENIKHRGEFVELFEWDPSMQWRKCKDSWSAGWMLIEHELLGDILQEVPKNEMTEIEPICRAVMTNDFPWLKSWLRLHVQNEAVQPCLDSALVMALARDFLECAVVLMDRCVPPLSADKAKGMPCSPGTMAFIRACSGSEFDQDALDTALEGIHPDTQRLAVKLFERLQDESRHYSGINHEDELIPDGLQHKAPQEEKSDKVKVIGRKATVRAEPDFYSDMVAEYTMGDVAQFKGFDESGQWYQVVGKKNATVGWTLINDPRDGTPLWEWH